MNKFYDEHGDVAVIINKGYGIGWSTFSNEYCEDLMFDAAIVNMILSQVEGWQSEIFEYCKTKYPDFYCIPYDLDVKWITPGRKFYITEYDGHECVCYPEDLNIFEA